MKPRILFYNITYNDVQKEICTNIVNILSTLPLEIDLLESNMNISYIKYDLAIICNKSGYNNFKKLKLDIPLIYVLVSDDLGREIIFDSSLYTHLLIINSNRNVYSKWASTNIFFPFMIKESNLVITSNKFNRLLVDIGNDKTLMSVLPLLNVYIDYEIDILTSQPYKFKALVNSHIKFSTVEKRKKLIDKADLFLADGYTALEGVLLQKPVFVLGERGFGGLIDTSNVKEHYKTGFSGRLGGVKEEHIPLLMLDYEIKKLCKKEVEKLKEAADELAEFCHETSQMLCQLISFFINLPSQKMKVYLQRNPYMDYIKRIKGTYWVVDKVYRKLLFEIDETEKRLVDYFDIPKQLNSVYKEMTGDLSHEEIEKSVDELLKYKLLDYCIYETIGTEL